MWLNLKTALQSRFALSDSEGLHSDLCSVGYTYMSAGKLLLDAKDDMKDRGMPSPDEGDAVALCFSEPNGSPFPNSNAPIAKSKIRGWPMPDVKQVTVIVTNPNSRSHTAGLLCD